MTDAYLFGILIYEVFNGGGFISADQLVSAKSIPQNVIQSYKRLIQPSPKTRLPIAHFLAQGIRKGGFFDTPLIHVAEFVENMGVKGETEREEFLKYGPISWASSSPIVLILSVTASYRKRETNFPKTSSK